MPLLSSFPPSIFQLFFLSLSLISFKVTYGFLNLGSQGSFALAAAGHGSKITFEAACKPGLSLWGDYETPILKKRTFLSLHLMV